MSEFLNIQNYFKIKRIEFLLAVPLPPFTYIVIALFIVTLGSEENLLLNVFGLFLVISCLIEMVQFITTNSTFGFEFYKMLKNKKKTTYLQKSNEAAYTLYLLANALNVYPNGKNFSEEKKMIDDLFLYCINTPLYAQMTEVSFYQNASYISQIISILEDKLEMTEEERNRLDKELQHSISDVLGEIMQEVTKLKDKQKERENFLREQSVELLMANLKKEKESKKELTQYRKGV